MKLNWDNLVSTARSPGKIILKEVIIDFNGPQVATFLKSERLWLGIVADEDEACERWIWTPISERELAALSSGQLETLDVFESRSSSVLDFHFEGGEFVREWSDLAIESFDTRALPSPGASLQTFMDSTAYKNAGEAHIYSFDVAQER